MTSLIFLAAVGIISVRGIDVAEKSSMDYSSQLLKTSIHRFENSIDEVEHAAKYIAETVEATYNVGLQPDTASFFRFINNTISDCPHIIGAGVYYEPYVFKRGSEHAGMFVNRNPRTGQTLNEWVDDSAIRDGARDYLDADWYKTPMSSGVAQWIQPFLEESCFDEMEYISSYTIPIRDANGDIFAVCDVDFSLNWIQEELLSVRPYENSNVIIHDEVGNYICNPLSETPNKGNVLDNPYFEGIKITADGIGKWKYEDYRGVEAISFKIGVYWLFCVRASMSNGWVMTIANYYDEAFSELSFIWLLVMLTIVVGLVFLFFVCRSIIHYETKPLDDFATAAGKITNGRFDVPIPEVKHKDEIYELGSTLAYMQTSVTNYIEELKRTTSEKERLAGELDVARKIQMQMLSKDFPKVEGWGIFASSIPARQVGGDLYDFYVKGDTLLYILGDVSGKGVPAALLMSISISAFRAAIRNRHTMAEIASIINNVFCRSNEDNMFITLNVGCINLKTGEMEVCNAGHNPVVLISPAGEASFLHLKSNIACGVMPGFSFEGDSLKLEKGSRLIIYSDGVTEAENAGQNQYGEDRLLSFAGTHSMQIQPSDEQVVAELLASVNGFVDGAEQFDDITLMSISC